MEEVIQETGQIDGTVGIQGAHNKRSVSSITGTDVEQLWNYGHIDLPTATRFN